MFKKTLKLFALIGFLVHVPSSYSNELLLRLITQPEIFFKDLAKKKERFICEIFDHSYTIDARGKEIKNGSGFIKYKEMNHIYDFRILHSYSFNNIHASYFNKTIPRRIINGSSVIQINKSNGLSEIIIKPESIFIDQMTNGVISYSVKADLDIRLFFDKNELLSFAHNAITTAECTPLKERNYCFEYKQIVRYECKKPKAYLQVSKNKKEFCSRVNDKKYLKQIIDNLENRMPVVQDVGWRIPFTDRRTGACWWESRLQRFSTYLAIYNPKKKKPSRQQALDILKKLFDSKVVEIPGFNNFSEFTFEWKEVLKEALNNEFDHDAIRDPFRGLRGSTFINPDELRKTMDRLYQIVEVEGDIAYIMDQMPGIDAHSHLISRMTKHSKGYHIYYVDNNYNYITEVVTYYYGEDSSELPFTPYIQRMDDLDNIRKAQQEYCQ